MLTALTAALAAPALPRILSGSQETGNPQPERPPLEKLLAPEDWEQVSKSPLAMDLDRTYGHGYSCAESMLLISLRHLKLSEDLVWAAAGFGGGLGRKDLCGFLTGGIMGLGHAAGTLKIERKEAKKRCSEAAAAYWDWWKGSFPLRCAEIRPPGSSADVCRRLGARSAVKINGLIDRIIAPPD
jgi:hypothetical protein